MSAIEVGSKWTRKGYSNVSAEVVHKETLRAVDYITYRRIDTSGTALNPAIIQTTSRSTFLNVYNLVIPFFEVGRTYGWAGPGHTSTQYEVLAVHSVGKPFTERTAKVAVARATRSSGNEEIVLLYVSDFEEMGEIS